MDYFNQFTARKVKEESDNEWVVTSRIPHPVYGNEVHIRFKDTGEIALRFNKDIIRQAENYLNMEIPSLIVIPDVFLSPFMKKWLYKISGETPKPSEPTRDYDYLSPL